MTTPRATIILVDDHPIVCEGLRAMLEPTYSVLDIIHDGRFAVPAIVHKAPQIVLLDVFLPGRPGLSVAAELVASAPSTRVVMLSMCTEPVYVDEAARIGVSGFVSKLASFEELFEAMEMVLEGKRFFPPRAVANRPPALAAGSAAGSRPAEPTRGVPLTPRQRQVLSLIARGYRTSEIAATLRLTRSAVEFHRGALRRSLGLRTTAALTRFAVENGIAD